MLGKPCRRCAVELPTPLGLVALKSTAQEFGEQLVITKPVGIIIDPLQEQTAMRDLFEHRQPARLLGQRGCQSAACPLGDRRRQHEVGDLRFKRVKDVLRQELADHVICAASD